MLLRAHELLHLSVFTRSGERLGRVIGFTMDSDTHRIVSYAVKKIFLPSITITAEQVIMLTTEKMIVENAIKIPAMTSNVRIPVAPPEPAAAGGAAASSATLARRHSV